MINKNMHFQNFRLSPDKDLRLDMDDHKLALGELFLSQFFIVNDLCCSVNRDLFYRIFPAI